MATLILHQGRKRSRAGDSFTFFLKLNQKSRLFSAPLRRWLYSVSLVTLCLLVAGVGLELGGTHEKEEKDENRQKN
jgi:hypothetical protein